MQFTEFFEDTNCKISEQNFQVSEAFSTSTSTPVPKFMTYTSDLVQATIISVYIWVCNPCPFPLHTTFLPLLSIPIQFTAATPSPHNDTIILFIQPMSPSIFQADGALKHLSFIHLCHSETK